MKKKKLITAAAFVCTVVLTAGTVMAAIPQNITGWHGLSRATFVWENREAELQMPMLENALRQYFGLEEDDALTAELLEQVTSIRFELSSFDESLDSLEGYENRNAVKCVINDGVLPGAPAAAEDDLYGYEVCPRVIRMQYFDLSPITDEAAYKKFWAFYTPKAPTDSSLTERGVAEMNAKFPNTVAAPLMIMDPDAKQRELTELLRISLTYGFANLDTLIDGMTIDFTAEDAAQFPNLEIMEFMDGLVPAEELPVPVVSVEGGGSSAPEDVAEVSISENEEGIVFESTLLNNAVRQYFGLEEEEPLTEEMTAQIENICFCASSWQEGLASLEGYEDKFAVKCIINGGAVIGEDGEKYASINEELELFESLYNGKKSLLGYEVLPVTVRTKYLRADEIADDWDKNKMASFYVSKNIGELSDSEAVEDLLLMHPCLVWDEFSYIDPMAKPRELAELLKIGFECGIVNEDAILDSTVIRLHDTWKLPDLVEITCEDGIKVIRFN